jgi:hypothetical protein
MAPVVRVLAVTGVVLMLAGTANFGPLYPEGAAIDAAPTATQSADPAGPAALPRITVDVPPFAMTGRIVNVPAGGDLQAALEKAQGGDIITLAPGATYKGPFQLRRKEGDRWIVITTAAKDLPAAGRHVTPADAPRMPKLVTSTGTVFRTEPGAHHYRLVGLEIAPEPGADVNTLLEFGADERAVAALPHHVIVDRCFIHGDPKAGTRRGIAVNGAHIAVVDSYISDFKHRTADAQAISGWNGPGPIRIAGNYLEASGENIMFGGGDPAVPNLVPSDIEVVRNHLSKPLRWKKDHPSYEGTEWAVKNLFELKNARRVLVDGNLLEYNWPQAQNGFAVLFTVRNQDGGAPWSVVEDVTFSNNVIRHVGAGINILGRDDNHTSQQTRRIAIRNNIFLDVGGQWGSGRVFQLLEGTAGVVIEHNTAFQTGGILFGGDKEPHTGFVFRENVMPHNEHGITASGTGPGTSTLDRFFPGAVFRGNVLPGARSAAYPQGNTYPASLDEISPASARRGATLASAQLSTSATPGHRPGADVAAIEKALGPLASRLSK